MHLRQLLADARYELILSYFCNADIYRELKIWSVKTTYTESDFFNLQECMCIYVSVWVCTPTICFSPGFPELKVVARVEEQGSLYHGTLPDCVVLLMDRV